MNRNFAMFVVLMCVVGCSMPTVTTEFSETKTEPGIIYDVAFMPSGHGSTKVYTDDHPFVGQEVKVDIPEQFSIVFKCQHGKFVIQSAKARDLYHRLDKGDKVLIHYREEYRVTKDGDKPAVREMVDLDFLDAVLDPKHPRKVEEDL